MKYDHFQGFINVYKTENRQRTEKTPHVLLSVALDQAMKNDLIVTNPAKMVTSPKQGKHEATVLSPEELVWFIKVLDIERLEYLYMFQLATETRHGKDN